MAVAEELRASTKAHGGIRIDETTGETKFGDRVDIQLWIYFRKGKKLVRETKKMSAVIRRHHESRGN